MKYEGTEDSSYNQYVCDGYMDMGGRMGRSDAPNLREESEAEYLQIQSRLVDCWCGEKPEIYSRCSSDGSKTTVIYTYIQCDACRTTSKNTVTSDDPKKNFTLDDIIKDWNTLIAKEKAS